MTENHTPAGRESPREVRHMVDLLFAEIDLEQAWNNLEEDCSVAQVEFA